MAITCVVSGQSLSHSVRFALASLLDNRNNIHDRIISDNTTTISYINSMGGCKATECNFLTKYIWDWARERNVWLSAAHIPGSNNVDADWLFQISD